MEEGMALVENGEKDKMAMVGDDEGSRAWWRGCLGGEWGGANGMTANGQ